MNIHNIEKIRLLKKNLECDIFNICKAFQAATGLKIKEIEMINPYRPAEKDSKLTGIELTIEI